VKTALLQAVASKKAADDASGWGWGRVWCGDEHHFYGDKKFV